MDNFRSRSHRYGRMEMEVYGGQMTQQPYGLRCYSAPFRSSSLPKEMRSWKENTGVGSGSTSFRLGGWSLKDPDMQRKKRIVSYKAYAVEGKMKGSLKKSFKWLKDTYKQVLYGY